MKKTSYTFKKALASFLALVMVVLSTSLFTTISILAADDSVTYLAPVYDTDGNVTFDGDGNVVMEEKTLADGTYNVVTESTTVMGTTDTAAVADANGEYWYVVNSAVSSDSNGLTITGNVNLILCDGASASYRFDTISVTEGNELTIYGQANGTGILNGNTENSSGAVGAGIGGDDVNPNAGKITINGGTVSARGMTNSGAGIGGGKGGNGGEITINGGTVKATGGTYYGAGIGGAGGGDSGTIVINGGVITAIAGDQSAAIGASSTGSINGATSLIKINGGTINATGVSNAAAIGGCYKGTLEGVEIRGGTLNISDGAVSLGVGRFVKQAATNPYVNIYGGIVNAVRIGCNDSTSGYTKVDVNIHGGEVRVSSSIGSAKGDSGQITITGGKVIANAAVSSARGSAAIGGGTIDATSGGSGYVTITGGYVEAYGGGSTYGGAGIGGAYKGHGIVKVSGGCIIAEGGPGADGIGSGSETDQEGVNLTFSGGVGINPDDNTSTAPSNPDTPSIEESQTVSTGAIVFATGITNFSADAAKNYTGIICFKYGGTEVYSPSEFVFTDNLTVPADYTLELKEHEKITFTKGTTLTVNGTFINNGTLTLMAGATVTGEGEMFATQSGKSFEGWYEDHDRSVAFASFGTPVSENTTLYPKFTDGDASVELDIQGITTVESAQFHLGGTSTYSGTPRAYLNNAYIKDVEFKVSYYALTVDENGEVLSRKEISKSEVLYIGIYETVIEVVDNTNDGVEYYGSRSFRTEIIQRELKVTTRNQIIRADGSVSNLLYTITSVDSYLPDASVSLTLTVTENDEIVFTEYKVLDSNGKDITWNCSFVQNRVGIAAALPESSDEYTVSVGCDNIRVPNQGELSREEVFLKAKIGSTTYYIVPDTVEFLNEGLQGLTYQDGWIYVTPDASRNTRDTTSGTSNKKVVNATASASFGETTISATGTITLLWYPSAPTSVVICKDGEQITEDRLNVSSGATATYTAKVLDQYGYEVTDQTIAWSVSDIAGVTLDNGVLTVASGTESGTVTVTAIGGGKSVDLSVALVGESEPDPEPTEPVSFAGGSLTLGDDIAVHFYMELDEAIVADSGAYLLFTFADGDTETVPVSEAAIDTATVAGKTFYKFTCAVNAKEMTDLIRARIYSGDYVSEEFTYSVKRYADTVIANAAGVYDEETVAFVKAMLNFGAYSQTYLDYHTDALANAGLAAEEKDVSAVTAQTLAPYQPTAVTLEGYGSFVGSSLTLKTKTILYVYFKPADGADIGALRFTVNGKEVTPMAQGDYYVIALENLAASELDETYRFTATAADDEAMSVTFACSALSYCYSVLSNDSFSDTLKDTVRAIYLYNQAANAYALSRE